MTFTKTVVDGVKDYLKNNIEPLLVLCEAQYIVTIPRAKHFDIKNFMDNQFPFVMVYEARTPYEMETIDRDLKKMNFAVDIVDSRAELDKLRINLHSYRDAICELIESRTGKNLGGAISGVVQAFITEVLPPAVLHESGNYRGFTAVKFNVEVI